MGRRWTSTLSLGALLLPGSQSKSRVPGVYPLMTSATALAEGSKLSQRSGREPRLPSQLTLLSAEPQHCALQTLTPSKRLEEDLLGDTDPDPGRRAWQGEKLGH